MVCSVSALDHPGPQANSVSLSGTMPGPAPKIAATIVSPIEGQHIGTTPVTISGTCPSGTLVELYKNDIFAGSTVCNADGRYSLDVDLLIGKNTLVSRVYDNLNQPGPDSQPITVYYDALPPQSAALAPLNFGGAPLLLNTDAVYRGVFPGQALNIPIDILGGTPPYAVNIQWGDSTNKVIPRNDNITFTAGHTYRSPGTYQITLQASDSQGRVAFLTVAAIVNGQRSIAATNAAYNNPSVVSKLLILWPLYTSLIAIVISFWLGERREKKLIANHPLAPPRLHLQM